MPKKTKENQKNVKQVKLMFLSVLISLIKKNSKLIVRSKSSSLVIIFGPLLIIGLVGAAFNTSSLYDRPKPIF